MITCYDYLNIAFYFCFIIGIGIHFSRRSKNTSDYFRGGGILPWWVAGVGAWMAGFSAWTFTGAAGKMYLNGPYVLGLYYANLAGLVLIVAYTCHRFRRMRVITPIEAVRMRFGLASQQFLTWIRLPFLVIFSGMGLYIVSVFMGAVFSKPLWIIILLMGVSVTIISLLGGSFAVAASDFVQMLLVVTVTVTVAILALNLPEIGGISGLVAKAPRQHFDWSGVTRPDFFWMWVLALTVTNILAASSMDASAKYLMARSDRHARLMVLIPLAGTVFGPLLWIIPPMVAAVLHPMAEMQAQFPGMARPEEAAFLMTARDVLPNGMLGLLLCGIFAATLTTMDAGLNQGAGIFVRNFYLPILNPHCPEKKLMLVSKLCTATFGVLIIGMALVVDRVRQASLFDLLNQVGVGLGIPLAVPLCLGMFYKRTPPWSLWSTAILGLLCSLYVSLDKFLTPIGKMLTPWPRLQQFAEGLQALVLKPDLFTWLPGFGGPFLPEERTQFTLFATVALVSVVCVSWFFFTSLFYGRTAPADRQSIDELFERMRTPLETRPSEEKREDHAIAGSIGRLAAIYGAFITLLLLIPNSWGGRFCYLACGGTMVAVGLFLMRRYGQRPPPTEGPAGAATAPAATHSESR